MSLMQKHLSHKRFFEPKRLSPGVDAVLLACLKHRLALQVDLEPDGVTLSAVPGGPPQSAFSIRGLWRSPRLEGELSSVGVLLLAPFVFWIEQLKLSHTQLFTIGRADRSVADAVMRNYFHAACRGERMVFSSQPLSPDPGTAKASRQLLRTYKWIVKANLADDIFNAANTDELILASAHLPLPAFSTPLLADGAQTLLHLSAAHQATAPRDAQKQAFRQLREELLAHYRP
jgi:hypothetical protein